MPKLERRRIRQLATTLIMAGVLLCIFPYPSEPFLWWADQSLWIAGTMLAAGLLFAFINRTRLMFVCLGASAAIAFHHYSQTNYYARPDMDMSISAGHLSCDSIAEHLTSDDEPKILLVSCSGHFNKACESLHGSYPFSVLINHDPQGRQYLLSKVPLDAPDTIVARQAFRMIVFGIASPYSRHARISVVCPLDTFPAPIPAFEAINLAHPWIALGFKDVAGDYTQVLHSRHFDRIKCSRLPMGRGGTCELQLNRNYGY